MRTGGCFLSSRLRRLCRSRRRPKKNDHQDLEDLEERRRWLFCHPRALLPVGSLEEEEAVMGGLAASVRKSSRRKELERAFAVKRAAGVCAAEWPFLNRTYYRETGPLWNPMLFLCFLLRQTMIFDSFSCYCIMNNKKRAWRYESALCML